MNQNQTQKLELLMNSVQDMDIFKSIDLNTILDNDALSCEDKILSCNNLARDIENVIDTLEKERTEYLTDLVKHKNVYNEILTNIAILDNRITEAEKELEIEGIEKDITDHLNKEIQACSSCIDEILNQANESLQSAKETSDAIEYMDLYISGTFNILNDINTTIKELSTSTESKE